MKSASINAPSQLANALTFDSRRYNFVRINRAGRADLQVTGDLSASGSGKVLTFTESPAGMAVGSYVYISAGTGTAEAVPITATTCATGGGGAGTITVTTANTHTGAWKVTSATAGIQEAVNALSADGGKVSISAGVHHVHAPITINKSNVTIEGRGGYTRVITTSATADVFHFNGPGAGGRCYQSNIFNLYIGHNTADKTAGAGVKVTVGDIFNAKGVWVVGFNTAFEMYGGGSSVIFEDCYATALRASSGVGFLVDGTLATITNCGASSGNPIQCLAAFRLRSTAGLYINTSETFAAGNGILVDPDQNSLGNVENLFINHCVFDSGTGHALKIIPSGSRYAKSIYSTGSWYTGSGVNGAIINTYDTAYVKGVSFMHDRFLRNGWNGIIALKSGSGDIEDVKAIGCTIAANNTPLQIAQGTILSISVASNTATVNTWAESHGLAPGDTVVVTGSVAKPAFNATYTVASTPTAKQFTFTTSGVTDGAITDSIVITKTSVQYGGVVIGSDIGRFKLADNSIGPYDGEADTQNLGIRVQTGTSDNYQITDNRILGASNPLLDGGSGVNKIIKDTLVVQGERSVTTAAAASLTVGPLVEVLTLTGNAAAVLNLAGGWNQRRLTIIFTDGSPAGVASGGTSGAKFAATTAAVQYVPMECVFVDDAWFCK